MVPKQRYCETGFGERLHLRSLIGGERLGGNPTIRSTLSDYTFSWDHGIKLDLFIVMYDGLVKGGGVVSV